MLNFTRTGGVPRELPPRDGRGPAGLLSGTPRDPAEHTQPNSAQQSVPPRAPCAALTSRPHRRRQVSGPGRAGLERPAPGDAARRRGSGRESPLEPSLSPAPTTGLCWRPADPGAPVRGSRSCHSLPNPAVAALCVRPRAHTHAHKHPHAPTRNTRTNKNNATDGTRPRMVSVPRPSAARADPAPRGQLPPTSSVITLAPRSAEGRGHVRASIVPSRHCRRPSENTALRRPPEHSSAA